MCRVNRNNCIYLKRVKWLPKISNQWWKRQKQASTTGHRHLAHCMCQIDSIGLISNWMFVWFFNLVSWPDFATQNSFVQKVKLKSPGVQRTTTPIKCFHAIHDDEHVRVWRNWIFKHAKEILKFFKSRILTIGHYTNSQVAAYYVSSNQTTSKFRF